MVIKEKLMEQKNEYETPSVTIVVFLGRDVIATSVGSSGGFDGEVDEDW